MLPQRRVVWRALWRDVERDLKEGDEKEKVHHEGGLGLKKSLPQSNWQSGDCRACSQ